MRHNIWQHGFAVIETLLVLVILGIIGGTGYYIYQANNKTIDTYDAANASSSSLAPKKTKKPVITSDEQKYVEVVQKDGSIKTVAPSSIAKTDDQKGVLAAIKATCTSAGPYVIVNYQVFTATGDNRLYVQSGNYAHIDASCGESATSVDQLEGSGQAIYARKLKGVWKVDIKTQEAVVCKDVDGLGYPAAVIPECEDLTTNTTRAPK